MLSALSSFGREEMVRLGVADDDDGSASVMSSNELNGSRSATTSRKRKSMRGSEFEPGVFN